MEAIKTIEAAMIPSGQQSTVRVTVTTEHGSTGTAELPAGISVGSSEAKLVDPAQAVRTITDLISPALVGSDVLEQRSIDQKLMELDGTTDRSHLGVNSLLPVSLATCRAAAGALSRPLYHHIAELAHAAVKLPIPIQVMIEGGAHAPVGSTGVTLQECSLIGPTADGERVLTALTQLVANQRGATQSGGEGGLILPIQSNHDALQYLAVAAAQVGLSAPQFAIDIAASHTALSPDELMQLMHDFPLAVVEDPVAEDDLAAWSAFTTAHGQQLIVAADDLTVGNPLLIKDAVKSGTANALVVKLNQTATLSELFDLIDLVRVGNWQIIISHRGHETPDAFIADLAVGVGADYLKAGTTRSPERKTKYERLAVIATEISQPSPTAR